MGRSCLCPPLRRRRQSSKVMGPMREGMLPLLLLQRPHKRNSSNDATILQAKWTGAADSRTQWTSSSAAWSSTPAIDLRLLMFAGTSSLLGMGGGLGEGIGGGRRLRAKSDAAYEGRSHRTGLMSRPSPFHLSSHLLRYESVALLSIITTQCILPSSFSHYVTRYVDP